MLDSFIEEVNGRRKRFTVYSAAGETDLADRLATRNVSVEHRPVPSQGPEPFVTIHDGPEFLGAVRLADLETLLAPPVARPGDRAGLADGYRALLDVLEETLFTALDRRQLLATSREFEDRALRVGTGTLRVSFQSLSAFEAQTGVYRHVAAESDLRIHVYGRPDWTPPTMENVTYHADSEGRLEPFWCLAFDGGTDATQACALLARERAEGFLGFWTYDSGLVADILATLEGAP
jgi:hypothetical protein